MASDLCMPASSVLRPLLASSLALLWNSDVDAVFTIPALGELVGAFQKTFFTNYLAQVRHQGCGNEA